MRQRLVKRNKGPDWWLDPFMFLTGIYIGGAGYLIVSRWGELSDLKLNELGDFLAGAFGPPAFLWLIIGYLLQRYELRENRKALKMQAAELRASASQQTKIADYNIRIFEMERRRLAISLYPRLEFNVNSPIYGNDGIVSVFVQFKLIENEYKELEIFIENDAWSVDDEDRVIGPMKLGESKGVLFNYVKRKNMGISGNEDDEWEWKFYLKYMDDFGNVGKIGYKITRTSEENFGDRFFVEKFGLL